MNSDAYSAYPSEEEILFKEGMDVRVLDVHEYTISTELACF